MFPKRSASVVGEVLGIQGDIRQEPVVAVEVRTAENVKNGTSAKLWWPVSACSKLADATVRFLQLADDYTVLNPHLTLSVGVDVIFPVDRFEKVAGLMKPRKRRRMTEEAKRQAADRLRQYQFAKGESSAPAAVQQQIGGKFAFRAPETTRNTCWTPRRDKWGSERA